MNTRESDFWNERSGPRIAPEHFGDIVATAADMAIVLTETGGIISITTNPLNSAMGRVDHWEGRKISDFLALDSREKVLAQLEAVSQGRAQRPPAIEVNHVDGAAWAFPVRYTVHGTGRDGRLLMLGRDMRPVAELQQRLVRAQAALEKDYEAERVYETRYRVLLESSPDAFVLLDVRSGKVIEMNQKAAHLMQGQAQAMVGTAFAQEFNVRKRGEFIDELYRAAKDKDGSGVTTTLRRQQLSVVIDTTLFRNAGDRALLCRITPAAQTDRSTVGGPDTLSSQLLAFYNRAGDGMALIDGDMRILSANEALLSMMEVDSVSELRGRPFGDFLSRGIVDMKVLTDETQLSAHPTHLISTFGTQRNVEITSVNLGDSGGSSTHALIVRDMARRGHLEEADGPVPSHSAATNRALALVGSAPLRDIVASMTDVLEKQCIEAAVELTNNNRVATAEMLGLSRQSLYVKLRKYGLLQRDES